VRKSTVTLRDPKYFVAKASEFYTAVDWLYNIPEASKTPTNCLAYT